MKEKVEMFSNSSIRMLYIGCSCLCVSECARCALGKYHKIYNIIVGLGEVCAESGFC